MAFSFQRQDKQIQPRHTSRHLWHNGTHLRGNEILAPEDPYIKQRQLPVHPEDKNQTGKTKWDVIYEIPGLSFSEEKGSCSVRLRTETLVRPGEA